MGQLDKMLFYLGFKKPNNSIEATPNTWGHQVYEHQFRKMKRDHQLDLNNHTYHRGFIERFKNTYVNGVHLKNRMNDYHLGVPH
jgi:hypothetical protein